MELKDVFEPIVNFLRNFQKKENSTVSKDKAKERLQLVLMQDRASVSPDFFEMMKKEIIEVIKKYIEIDEELLEVQLTRGFEGDDGSGPALYANIPIKNIKPVAKKVVNKEENIPIDELSEKEAKEMTDNIMEEIKTVTEEKVSSKSNKQKEKNKNIDKVEEVKENIEKVEETIEEEAEEVIEVLEEDIEEVDAKSGKFDNFKEKLNGIKDGAKDTFSKAKTSAKDGINKIKSKVKAKN